MTAPLATWYSASPELALAARALLLPRPGEGARAVLLEGPPGAGKSAFAQALAEGLGAELVVHQLHEWSDADELFAGVDVAAAVAGEADAVRQPGVLAVAAEASLRATATAPAVLLLDELDKAPERTEALLLDWLQSGRTPLAPGRHILADHDRLVVVATSNGARDLSDALLRRVRRVVVPTLPADVVDDIVRRQTGAPPGVVTLICRACRRAAEADGAWASPQELGRAVAEAVALASSAADMAAIVSAWGARGEAGRAWVRSPAGRDAIAAAWGELQATRRREGIGA